MLVVMEHDGTEADVGRVVRTICGLGYDAVSIPGTDRTAVGTVGNDGSVAGGHLEGLPGLLQVIRVIQPYKPVSREWQPDDTVVELASGTRIGGPDAVLPLRVPGSGRPRAGVTGEGPRAGGYGDRHPGAEYRTRSDRRRVCRNHPDRIAQHAELCTAAACRSEGDPCPFDELVDQVQGVRAALVRKQVREPARV
jgi:hypothetical protein